MTLKREVELVQNAALGAALEWAFCRGYSPEDEDIRGTPMLLLFLVLPLCYTAQLRELAISTREASGLRKFEEKLRMIGADRVWTLSSRAVRYRDLTVRSLAVAIASRLLRLEPATGTVWTQSGVTVPALSANSAPLIRVAERLGVWCGMHPIEDVAAILRVQL